MNKSLVIFFSVLMTVSLFFVFGVKFLKQPANSGNQKNKLIVTTSFYPLYFFASQIAPDTNIKNLTPAGSESHDFDPSAKDVARIENSQLLILNGGVES